jgi:hypothetical protein
MSELDVAAFLAQLDPLGMRLTALQLADGTLKIYRWRMSGARDNAQEIETLWKSTIGEDRARNDLLARHLIAMQAKRIETSGNNMATKPPNDA